MIFFAGYQGAGKRLDARDMEEELHDRPRHQSPDRPGPSRRRSTAGLAICNENFSGLKFSEWCKFPIGTNGRLRPGAVLRT